MIKHFGLGQILTPYSPEIQNRVAELVSPWQEADLTLVRELTALLDSDAYAERQAAAEQLEKEYKGNESILSRLVHDPQFHPEIRAATRKLIRDKVDKDKLSELDFVDRVADSLDASYLVDLIQLQTDPEKQQVLVDRLRALSPDLVDSNIADADVVSLVVSQHMNAWVSDQVSDVNKDSAINVLEEKGHFQKVASHTGQLVRLIWHEDELRVDRDHWKEPFGGRDISDISKEIQELVKKNNLPKDWYNGGGPEFAEASAKHPQVLFEKLEEQCAGGQGNLNRSHTSYGGGYAGNNTPNRQFDLGKMKGELTFDKSARNSRRGRSGNSSSGSLDKKPFMLSLTEKGGPQRSLTIDEIKPGQLRVMITGDSSNYIIQLILKKDLAIVQDIRGSKVIAYEAKSFRELQKQNEKYFGESFFPLLHHLGIEIAPDVDAGSDAKETTMDVQRPGNKSVAGK